MSGALNSIMGSVNPVFGPLTVEISSTSVSGFGYGLSSPVTAVPSIINIVGGEPPYTIDWERVSGSTAIYATDDNGLTTYFSVTTNVGTVSGVWRAKVTDALATIAYSPSVSITLQSYEYPDIGIIN